MEDARMKSLTDYNNEGQKDGSEGNTKDIPWKSPWDSDEEYQEKLDAYNKGYENGLDNQDDD